MFESTDFGLVHFHRAEFDRLIDGDAADVVDGFLAIRDGTRTQLLEGLAGGCDRLVGVVKNALVAAEVGCSTASELTAAAHFFDNLSDQAADEFFTNLHD